MLDFIMTMVAASSMAVNVPPRVLHYIGTPQRPERRKNKVDKNEHFEGTVRARLTFNPRGRVIHCDIVASAAPSWVEDISCKYLSTAVAVPAKDATGAATFGTMVQGILYMGNDKVDVPVAADLSVGVNHMPDGALQSVTKVVALAVDASGTVNSCDTYRNDVKYPELQKATCELATKRLTFKPALNEADVPTPSVQLFSVEFSAADAPLHRIERRPF